MPRENFSGGGGTSVDPFYPDGYVSSDQDRMQIRAQKEKYAANVNSINFKFPLRSFRRGFFAGNVSTLAAIREDIKTLLMTSKGERVMHKSMGTSIPVAQGQLFELSTQNETFEKIRLEVEAAFTSFLPFLKITSIKMVTQAEEPGLGNNKIRIRIQYMLVDQSALSDTVNITIKNQ